ncbi:hypothetical protein Tco_1426887, partial [Tanacetum coccineum]
CGGRHVADSELLKVAIFWYSCCHGVCNWFKDVAVQSSVTTSRYVVPTGRVNIPAGRYVVPTGKDNVIVSTGRTKVISVGRTKLVLSAIEHGHVDIPKSHGEVIWLLDDEIPRNQIPTLRRDLLGVAIFLRWVEAKKISLEVESEDWRRLLLHQMCLVNVVSTDGREEKKFVSRQ